VAGSQVISMFVAGPVAERLDSDLYYGSAAMLVGIGVVGYFKLPKAEKAEAEKAESAKTARPAGAVTRDLAERRFSPSSEWRVTRPERGPTLPTLGLRVPLGLPREIFVRGTGARAFGDTNFARLSATRRSVSQINAAPAAFDTTGVLGALKIQQRL